ncbi:MAG: hypothetical protein HWD61_08595 [Parachlamydiaceae bacterium]|nr:MAG: hypothetical protein HWD61_08595 [Parachlamydiaceae bacterium]
MVFHPSFNKDSISLKADRAEYYPNSQNIPVARSKSFQPLNIAELFGLNIERFIHTLEKRHSIRSIKLQLLESFCEPFSFRDCLCC